MSRRNVGGRRVRCGDGLIRTLIDANYVLAATITAEDNAKGVCGDPNNCVIANAIIRTELAQGRIVQVSIGADKAYLVRDDVVLRFQVPANESALIRTFDSIGAFPEGFVIRLVPVQPHDRLGARAKSRGAKDRTKPPSPPRGERQLPTRHLRAPHALV